MDPEVMTYSVKNDSDRSSNEKVPVTEDVEHAGNAGVGKAGTPYIHDLPPDPDAHLSDAERAAIVS